MEYSPIVVLEKVRFSYENGFEILRNVDLRIDKGCVTALLGPSASGKTTILSSIVGIIKPSSGQVIRHYNSLGFMPQSYCLHEYFTVREIFKFYAMLYDIINPDTIINKIIRTMDLPPDRIIQNCSGGMKRRISLCCAVMHSPDLIILDEPSVGVDPLLRRRMWDFLLDLAKNGSAIVVSTHYAEEASLAHKFAFLRKGRILQSGNVNELGDMGLNYYEQCLEDERRFRSDDPKPFNNKIEKLKNVILRPKLEFLDRNPCNSRRAFSSMFYKNLIVLKRHKLFMMFQAILPLLTVFIFTFSIGRSLKDIHITVLNEDQSDCSKQNVNFICPDIASIISPNLDFFAYSSCKIIDNLTLKSLKIQFHEKTMSNAKNRIMNGESVAIIHFPKGFSESLTLKLKNSINSIKETHKNSSHLDSIGIILDTTNKLVVDQVYSSLHQALEITIDKFFKECEISLNSSSILMNIDFSTDEKEDYDLTNGMMPVMANAILYFMAFALTADLTAGEKEAGLLVRISLTGVKFKSILISQLLVQSIVVLIHIFSCLLFLKISVCPQCSLSLYLLIGFLYSLQSLSGMTIGILLSTICSGRDQVIQYGLAIIFPTFLLCGLLWPLTSLPLYLKALSYSLPVTLSGQLIRRIIYRQCLDNMLYLFAVSLIPLIWSGGCIGLTLFVASRSGSLYRL
ncbi:ABC transporter G family member 20 [Lepeophtheirus salmonis]|uniref:ABC transporter G family member 20 n=1 Tax=Lepeophtheirus salmonis TaxID=72036 RepID=UPI001AE41459|nr:ABC transporter G family member 20-like [Lepeophtheirus salmonis]XP_040578831.1 ABC transporter G family member 20-like [Lepeophtheirus salmonis]XP_040578838.1 ABC transporter G family member 20-like [Lepeophtheirus salmonis]XP_040578847.1 ABC transporter G family member 20-like [Lepeophtheirus salmonis]